VPAFIDAMLKDAYPREDQERFIAGLKDFEARAQSSHERTFLKLEPAHRLTLVRSVHDAATAEELKLSLPPAQLRRPFILMTKELALLGFFTSKSAPRRCCNTTPSLAPSTPAFPCPEPATVRPGHWR
jgi:hypothetical protein